jgi:Mn2+/Fe2+ NRAMP family transporter
MGWENGVNKRFSEAPQFYGLYTVLVFLGAGIILLPRIPLFRVMLISQVVNGLVLPVVLVFMLILINSSKLMGKYKNGKLFNAVSWVTVAVLTVLTAAYALAFVF